MAETIKIGSELESVATGNVVAAASAIKDKTKNKYQDEINAETDAALVDRYTKDETYNKTELNNMITTPDQQYVSVTANSQTASVTDVLPATGAANTIYRVGNWDGSQFDASVYSEYAWNGSAYIYLSTKSQAGGEVFDISAYHVDTKYVDLSAALGVDGVNIPQSLRKGGMSIKFVQSSDNKYVQYRLMANQWSTNESDWQGVDKEPIYESKNLVESGGVDRLFSLLGDAENFFTDKDITWLDGYISNNGNVMPMSFWKYAIIDVSNFKPGYYTLWRDSDSHWDASPSYHHIYKYSSADIIDNSTFLGYVSASSFEITEQVKVIIITSSDSYEKTLLSVRLSFGEDADYNEGIFTIFKKNIPYLSSYITKQNLDTLFGQNQNGVSYPFIKSYTHADSVDFSVTPNRYIKPATGVVVGGGNNWKLYTWWAAEEDTAYTIYEDSENTFNDYTYHHVGCFSSKNIDSYLGIALDKGNGVHVTLTGTKFIALTAENRNYTKENIKLIKGTNKEYNTAQKNVLVYNIEHGLGVDSNSIVGDLTPKQQGKYRHFDLSTSGVIMFIGNSYTAGGFSLKKKQYEYLVGMLTNFIPVNYGLGAVSITARYNSFLNDLNDGQSGSFPKPSQLNIKYVVLAEARNFNGSATEYKVALVKFIELLRGRGIVPILSTEHYGLNSDASESERIQMMQEVADTYNIPFLKWGDFAQAMKVQGFPGFLYGSHVATRTYWTWANGIIPYINTLDYVDGIKLFRKRSTESFSELPTFNNIFERGKYFEEFTMSGAGNTPATEKYVDRQNQGVAENIGNEYGTLMKKIGSVTAGNYLLIQITTENNINELIINIDADNVTSAYFKRNDGSWNSINYSSTIKLSQYIKYFGECPYLLLVGENISVRNVSVDYLGVDRRKNQRHLQKGIYGESIVYPFIDSEHWNGTFTYYTPIVDENGNIEPLPNGINNVAELKTNESSLTQTFIFSNERYNADKCQLKILARYFPKYIKTDADWENTEITTETFDMAKLSITIGNINIERYVGMWWNEILVDVYLPGNSSILIESPDGKNVQVAKVELIKYT